MSTVQAGDTGNPTALRKLSGDYALAATRLRVVQAGVGRTSIGLGGNSWEGIAALAFQASAVISGAACGHAAQACGDAASALDQLASALEAAQAEIDAAVSRADGMAGELNNLLRRDPSKVGMVIEQLQRDLQGLISTVEYHSGQAQTAQAIAAGAFSEIAARAKPPPKKKGRPKKKERDWSDKFWDGFGPAAKAALGTTPGIGPAVVAYIDMPEGPRDAVGNFVVGEHLYSLAPGGPKPKAINDAGDAGWYAFDTVLLLPPLKVGGLAVKGVARGGKALLAINRAKKAERAAEAARTARRAEEAAKAARVSKEAKKTAKSAPEGAPGRRSTARTVDEVLARPAEGPARAGTAKPFPVKAGTPAHASGLDSPVVPATSSEIGHAGRGFGSVDAARAVYPSDRKVVEHLFSADAKGNGLHHIDGVTSSNGTVKIISRETLPGGAGVTRATFRVTLTNGVVKEKMSTFFPDSWTRDDVTNAITSIRANPTSSMRQQWNGIRLYGFYKGVFIKVVLDRSGRLVTAHPLA